MSNLLLQDSINFARPYLGYLNPQIGPNFEPSVSAANHSAQIICNPPLTWAWNRDKKTFTITQGTQDYAQSGYTDFGVLESVVLQPAGQITNVVGSGTVATMTAINQFTVGATVTITGLTNTVFNVTTTISAVTPTTFSFVSTHSVSTTPDTGLAVSGQLIIIDDIRNNKPLNEASDRSRPKSIAVQDNDDAGNVTFRFLSVPDQTYQVTLTYQMLPPKMALTAFTVTSVSFSTPIATLAGTFTGGANNAFAGYSFIIKGCTEPGNNGVFTCITSTAIALTFSNLNGVTNGSEPAGTTASALVPASTAWAPIPDDYSYIFNSLFLSFLFETYDETQKSQIWRVRGIGQLLSKAGGLSATEQETFLQASLGIDLYTQFKMTQTQQSTQARTI